MTDLPAQPLSRKERLCRVALLCCHFIRNLAFYRVGSRHNDGWATIPLTPTGEFWRTVNGNFIDTCVLEWCKLLGDCKDEHFWKNVVSDAAAFETALLLGLNMDAAAFERYRCKVRKYRDKFIAHLDHERVMDVPHLDIARSSVEFYHAYLLQNEVQVGDLSGLPDTEENLRLYYEQCEVIATQIYKKYAEI
jgi:hypothetical protein